MAHRRVRVVGMLRLAQCVQPLHLSFELLERCSADIEVDQLHTNRQAARLDVAAHHRSRNEPNAIRGRGMVWAYAEAIVAVSPSDIAPLSAA